MWFVRSSMRRSTRFVGGPLFDEILRLKGSFATEHADRSRSSWTPDLWSTLNQLIAVSARITKKDLLMYRSPRVTSQEDPQLVLERQGGRCFACKKELIGYWELDHHLPRYLGGYDDLHNRRALCVECNRRKGRRHPDEFYNVEGAL